MRYKDSRWFKYASSPGDLPCKYSTCGGGEQASTQLEAKTEAQTKKAYGLIGPGIGEPWSAVSSMYERLRESGGVIGPQVMEW